METATVLDIFGHNSSKISKYMEGHHNSQEWFFYRYSFVVTYSESRDRVSRLLCRGGGTGQGISSSSSAPAPGILLNSLVSSWRFGFEDPSGCLRFLLKEREK